MMYSYIDTFQQVKSHPLKHVPRTATSPCACPAGAHAAATLGAVMIGMAHALHAPSVLLLEHQEVAVVPVTRLRCTARA